MPHSLPNGEGLYEVQGIIGGESLDKYYKTYHSHKYTETHPN